MKLVLLLSSPLVCATAAAQTNAPVITVEAGQPAGKVSALLYGLMTEEINHAYDGGLYAELVRNRAFRDDAKQPAHWSVAPAGSAATISLDRSQSLNAALPVSLRLDARDASASAPTGIANEGYWGIPVTPSTTYRASFYAKAASGFSGPVTLTIQGDDSATVYARAQSPALTTGWKRYEVTLTTAADAASTPHARYVLSVQKPGTVWFSLVSLFPPTWNDRPNGFRRDLMRMLVDMHPRFLRFPGGCYLEGDTVENRFDWKKTIGPLSQRPGHKGYWDYRSTDGMGLLEFLLWCEDMRAEPVLAVYDGFSLKGNHHIGPGADLEPYVQDALDEIEYVAGDITTRWGAERAKDGHPAPFRLRYVEIGNEDFADHGDSYDGRFAQFAAAIKKRYPGLKCISTIGNEHPAKRRVKSVKPDALDEHYYRNYADFIKDAPAHFDRYDRRGPEIFVGEWASYESASPPWRKEARALNLPVTPGMKAALGDAAWMLAMERNSDLVAMQCYAPLLANVNPGAWQWRPNLIGYDALHAYGSPSYYAICMFANNVGDEILKTSADDTAVQVSATRDSATGRVFLKLLNPLPSGQRVTIALKNVPATFAKVDALTLAADPGATNSLEHPIRVVPVASTVGKVAASFTYTLPANAIIVLTLTP